VWGEIHISDSAIAQSIQRVRQALGDDAHKPRFIETVHGRGWRFIAPLHEEAGDLRLETRPPSTQVSSLSSQCR
jgi:DNA-binding winged helix-turn-helix (wHTH) protein